MSTRRRAGSGWSTDEVRGAWTAPVLAVALLALTTSCTETVEVDPSTLVQTVPSISTGSRRGEFASGSSALAVVAIVSDDPCLPVQTRDGWIRGTALAAGSRFTREASERLIATELTLYPAPLLERIGLKQVVLCATLSFEGTDCSAYADVERGRLYLSTHAGVDPAYLQRTVHHEIFHQVDFADDHELETDPRWEALNPLGFHYTQDAERLQADADASRPDDRHDGFIDRYATASPAEDKAELFTWIVTDRALVARRAGRDPILRRKVERLRAMLDGLGPYGRALIDL